MYSFSSTVVYLCCVGITQAVIQHGKTFVPTNEWQVVPPNQGVPPGLHIRMNIQTGEVEAKLMEPDEVNQKPDAPLVLVTDNPQRKLTTLNEQPLKELPHVLSKVEDDRHIKKRFRSYEELKKDFASLKMNVKTDAEIITGLMEELRQSPSADRLEFILEDLSYLLHQIDNGKLFADHKGLFLLVPYFRSKNDSVKTLALNCFSAAVQSNTHVKIIALQDGLLEEIRGVLMNTHDIRVLSTGLSTLSAFLRGFPSAQKYFFAKGTSVGFRHPSSGFDLLNDAFTMPIITADQLPKLRMLRIRILCLLGDIQQERSAAKALYENENQTQIDRTRWELYNTFDFENELRRSNWCTHLNTALLNDLNLSPTETDHDSLEKLLTATERLGVSTCRTELINGPRQLHDQLIKLEKRYALLAADELQSNDATDTFYSDMQKLVQSVMNRTTHILVNGRPIDEI